MPKNINKTVVVAYIPVLHRGYMQLFKKFSGAEALYVIGDTLIKETDYLRKDLRALKPAEVASFVKQSKLFKDVEVLDAAKIKLIDKAGYEIVLPDEDISREVGKKFKYAAISYYPIFLRWDRDNVEGADRSDPDEVLSLAESDKTLMNLAITVGVNSSDIFRRVGAVLVDSNGTVISTYSNHGEPTQHSPWMEGDPRSVFNRGIAIEMSLFTHAEAVLIAEAAKAGTALDGAEIYVTTFPCPACAKLIAHSGIKKVYYKDGYAVLDGKRILQDYSVELVRVLAESAHDNPDGLVSYVSKN
jgi:dCMP deaminase